MEEKQEKRRKKRKTKTVKDLLTLAKSYGVEENQIVLELVNKYNEQKEIIQKISDQIAEDGLTCKKEYVKGRENLVANPLLDVFQKHQDSASRTLDSLADAIVKFGRKPARKGKLSEIMAETADANA